MSRDAVAPALPGATPLERPRLVLVVLALLALAAVTAYMTLGVKGSWSFALGFRGMKLAGLLLVAGAISVSTVLFQTVTGNRLLTPSIMGFDALYVLIQTTLVFTLGSALTAGLDPRLAFCLRVAAMVCFSGLLFRWLFGGDDRDLHLLMLVGIVVGIFFRSLSAFMQRVLDPNEFQVLQDSLFANFNRINSSLLGISAVIFLAVGVVVLRLLPTLDVLALGRPVAISLGLAYRRTVTLVLVLVAVLVSVSTALVGPVTFFGLLVASVAHLLVGTSRHRLLLPAAMLVAVTCLVGGQVILERVFAFDTALSIIIEFVGGILFLILILRRGSR